MSDDLSAIDTDELKARLMTVVDRLDAVLIEIGPKIREIGNLRAEAAMIFSELDKRGVSADPAPERDGK
jgi:hypothetical protein